MKQICFRLFFGIILVGITAFARASTVEAPKSGPPEIDLAQVPEWSSGDLDFFVHGSMSTEFIPESVLRVFIETYPDLFPTGALEKMGAIPDPQYGWPLGFSRQRVPHLGNLSSVGINCASCHVGEVESSGRRVRVLGMTSHFDVEAFFRAVIVSTFRTAALTNMQVFLRSYLAVTNSTMQEFDAAWRAQEAKIAMMMRDDPGGSKGIGTGELHKIRAEDLELHGKSLGSADLVEISHSMLRLFHNLRAALHVPDEPPKTALPSSGPGRNDAFGLLSAILFGEPQPYAPVKFGLVWNVQDRPWVHWDGNTRSPIGRNLLAALGLGAPLLGKHAQLDFALVKRQTDLSEKIRAPRYLFAIDRDLAGRGRAHYQARCAMCHEGSEGDSRLHDPAEIGTDAERPTLFTQKEADLFNAFLASIETEGYQAAKVPGLRSTRKIWAASLPGVWARSPYLHNGSVRTMQELLTAPERRAQQFRRGSQKYSESEMGYADAGSYLFDTTTPGNSNKGHNYATDLSEKEKRELIEFLKTM